VSRRAPRRSGATFVGLASLVSVVLETLAKEAGAANPAEDPGAPSTALAGSSYGPYGGGAAGGAGGLAARYQRGFTAVLQGGVALIAVVALVWHLYTIKSRHDELQVTD
jgi:hypothetical protein